VDKFCAGREQLAEKQLNFQKINTHLIFYSFFSLKKVEIEKGARQTHAAFSSPW